LNFEHENKSNLSVMRSNVKSPTQFQGIDKSTEPIKMPSRKYSKNILEREETSLKKKLNDCKKTSL